MAGIIPCKATICGFSCASQDAIFTLLASPVLGVLAVQQRFLAIYRPNLYIFCKEYAVDQALSVRFLVPAFARR